MTAEKPNGSDPSMMDTELGRLVVEQQLATQEEVDQCLSLRTENGEDASQQTLADFLVQEGVVTKRQITRVTAKIDEARKGQQIPGYRIESKLGRGAMATVFKAHQLSLDRSVAIKVMPRRLSDNAEYVERFYREGQAAAKLNHANIVQAFDVGEAGGYHYFVMEYVKGHTVHDEIAEGKTFSEVEALKIVIQIARALEHAHGLGLIHRDVKPKNIMITESRQAKLADMGLAREASDSVTAQAEAGRAFGTPYYISPEQIRGKVDIDFRADIYSLGATFYHMVTGRVPFEGDTPAAVMHMHLTEPLKPPDHLNTELSSGLGEVVETMMAKDRRRRYSSTSDLLLDLEAISRGETPLQARKQIDTELLSGLANQAEPSLPLDTEVLPTAVGTDLKVYVILLAAGLVACLMVILLLLANR